MKDGFLLDEIHPDWLLLNQREPTDTDLARIEAELEQDAEQCKFNRRLNRLAHLCIRLQKNSKRPLAVYLRKIRRHTNIHIQLLVRQLIAAELLRQAKRAHRRPAPHSSHAPVLA